MLETATRRVKALISALDEVVISWAMNPDLEAPGGRHLRPRQFGPGNRGTMLFSVLEATAHLRMQHSEATE